METMQPLSQSSDPPSGLSDRLSGESVKEMANASDGDGQPSGATGPKEDSGAERSDPISESDASQAGLRNLAAERSRLLSQVEDFYEDLPRAFKSDAEAQEECLSLLADAAHCLASDNLTREEILQARQQLTRVAIRFARQDSSRFSFTVVVALVYMGGGIAIALAYFGYRYRWFTPDAELVFLSVPLPVWIWALVGTFTSMLLRAGQLPFADRAEALRWLVFRPIVGVVMGVIAYLLLTAGLIVFTGESVSRTPELVWVIAFVGAFSDTLSVGLLQKLIGNISSDRTVAAP